MGVVTGITAAAAIAGSAIQAANARKQMKRAEGQIESYDRQELDNKFENMPISTVGSDLMREETSRNVATSVNALKEGGTRTLLGGIDKVNAQGVAANRAIMYDLDKQVRDRNYAIAEDNARIRGMQEHRENQDLQGLGTMYEANRQTMWNGFGGMLNAGMYAVGNLPQGNNGGSVTGETYRPPAIPVGAWSVGGGQGLQQLPVYSASSPNTYLG